MRRSLGHFKTSVLLAVTISLAFLLLNEHRGIYFPLFDVFSEGASSMLQCNSTRSFKWEELSPTSELVWVDCFDSFTCSRLEVPLNYSDPQGEKAIIALIRQQSPLQPQSSDYAGPILFNPGGPGGSGVDAIKRMGSQMRTILGPTFDLVGFDPRGVAASYPRANFFSTEVERQLWTAKKKEVMLQDELARNWAQNQILAPLIAEQNNAGKDYLKHIHTENTARDMLYITEKYGFEKLKYMGFSYGTVLGSTFASLFPDRIERMILDGVTDVDNYYSGLWDNNLLDTEATIQAFFDGCHAAGPTGCPFWMPTPALIKQELDKLYETVQKAPISTHSSSGRYGVVDYEILRLAVFQALYKPWAIYPKLAQALQDLKGGNATAIFDLSGLGQDQVTCSCDLDKYTFTSVGEATTAIACNDGLNVEPDLQSFLKYSQNLREATPWADVWERIHLSCSPYPNYEKSHFQGPVGAANTSFPLLLIGNTADPVTPLWAAKKIGKRFGDAVVLTQDTPGHCSVSAPSVCTAKVVQDYMVKGKLPAEGTICNADSPIFPTFFGQDGEEAQVLFKDSQDQVLFRAMMELSKEVNKMVGPLHGI